MNELGTLLSELVPFVPTLARAAAHHTPMGPSSVAWAAGADV